MTAKITKALFVEELANTLSHFYDPGVLRHSQLLQIFGLDLESNPISKLQSLLTNAIEDLKPGESVPRGTNAWQIYHILTYRYVEQLIQREVASDLALSTRQLRRKEKTALEVLADHLWLQYNLGEASVSSDAPVPANRIDTESKASEANQMPSRQQELEWLEKTQPNESVELKELVEGVVGTIKPLAQNLGVSVNFSIPENCPPLTIQLTTVRQALLYIITSAVRFTPQGRVDISSETPRGAGCVQLQIKSQRGSASLVDPNRGKELEFAEKLLKMSSGSLTATIDPDKDTPFFATVVLPIPKSISLLVIDDNPDLLGLVQRYLSNTRYDFHGTSDPHTALSLAEELSPEIILLDVMLGDIDGWEMVGRLREHPKTRGSIIIVCTVLPQDQLALSLGATDFIRKPIRRSELLAVLNRQSEQLLRDASSSA